MVSIEMYFNKHRAVAYGVATVGASVANMTFPWITRFLIEQYAWMGALMISSGIVAQICVGAMMLRSLPEQSKSKEAGNSHSHKCTTKQSFVTQTKLLFTNGSYILHCLSMVLLLISASIGYTHLVTFAKSEGISAEWSNIVLTAIGAATIGR